MPWLESLCRPRPRVCTCQPHEHKARLHNIAATGATTQNSTSCQKQQGTDHVSLGNLNCGSGSNACSTKCRLTAPAFHAEISFKVNSKSPTAHNDFAQHHRARCSALNGTDGHIRLTARQRYNTTSLLRSSANRAAQTGHLPLATITKNGCNCMAWA